MTTLLDSSSVKGPTTDNDNSVRVRPLLSR